MALINIPLNSGLVTQVEDEEIGFGACTELTNADLSFLGKLLKRKGRGAAVSVAANINHITKWVYSGTAYYILTDGSNGKVYKATSLGSLTEIADFTGTDIRILNYGTQLRFAPGLSDYAKVYQNIDRKFFWSTYTYSAGLTMSTARPIVLGDSDGMSLFDAGQPSNPRHGSTPMFLTAGDTNWQVDGGSAVGVNSGLNYADDIYYYKLTKVYDGSQESSLSEDVFVSSSYASSGKVYNSNFTGTAYNTNHNNRYFGFQLQITESSFDERITAINVYRSKNDPEGPYYKIDTISTLSKDPTDKLADPGITRVTDAQVLRCGASDSTGKGYLVTSDISTLGVGESITQTTGSIVIGRVASGGIGSSDGYGQIISIEHTGGGTLGADRNYWAEPVTWPGGSGEWYSALTYNNLLYSNSWSLKIDDYVGAKVSIEGNDYDDLATTDPLGDTDNNLFSYVSRNNLKCIAIYSGSTNPSSDWLGNTETSIEVMMHKNYMWQDRGSVHHCHWLDMGLTDGAVHPFGTTSNKTRFKYSVNLDGRQYVGNVQILTNDDVSENHPDWVMFSELLQPDVIPITNYISIPDTQGGQITGLAKLMGDLVVFQEKGIYRVSIPSADPTTWSLIESEINLGCDAPNSIVEYENGVFFAARDHIYHLNSNFQAIPITRTIRDTYQAAYSTAARLHVDPKKERLLCRFGASSTTNYELNLQTLGNSETWIKWDTSTSRKADLWLTDENIVTHSVESGGTSYLCELEASSENETTSFTRTTGWIQAGDLDDYKTLKRLNIRYLSERSLKVEIYIDGDDSTAITWQDGDTYHTVPADTSGQDWYKCKPSIRCKYFKIKLSDTAVTNDIEIRRLEVEYE